MEDNGTDLIRGGQGRTVSSIESDARFFGWMILALLTITFVVGCCATTECKVPPKIGNEKDAAKALRKKFNGM